MASVPNANGMIQGNDPGNRLSKHTLTPQKTTLLGEDKEVKSRPLGRRSQSLSTLKLGRSFRRTTITSASPQTQTQTQTNHRNKPRRFSLVEQEPNEHIQLNDEEESNFKAGASRRRSRRQSHSESISNTILQRPKRFSFKQQQSNRHMQFDEESMTIGPNRRKSRTKRFSFKQQSSRRLQVPHDTETKQSNSVVSNNNINIFEEVSLLRKQDTSLPEKLVSVFMLKGSSVIPVSPFQDGFRSFRDIKRCQQQTQNGVLPSEPSQFVASERQGMMARSHSMSRTAAMMAMASCQAGGGSMKSLESGNGGSKKSGYNHFVQFLPSIAASSESRKSFQNKTIDSQDDSSSTSSITTSTNQLKEQHTSTRRKSKSKSFTITSQRSMISVMRRGSSKVAVAGVGTKNDIAAAAAAAAATASQADTSPTITIVEPEKGRRRGSRFYYRGLSAKKKIMQRYR